MGRRRTFHARRTHVPETVPDALRLALLFVPLLVQIVFVRLLETTMLRRGAAAPIEELLWTSGPLPLLNGLIGVGSYWLARKRTAHLPAVVPAAIATAVTALSSTLCFKFAPWWIVEWVTPTTLEVLRFDALIVFGLITATLLFLGVGGWRTRKATNTCVHFVVPFIMTLSAAGFAYFVATGSPADWQIMKYTVSNFDTLRELVAGSVRGHHLALMAAPSLWSLAVWYFLRARSESRASKSSLRPSAALAFAPIMLVLALVPTAEVTRSVNSGSLHRMMKMAAIDLAGVERDLTQDVGSAGTPDFDARTLVMERTDSTVTPNVVMILMESVRSRSSTPYHTELQTMPFLDSLASAGALVENMYAVVSYTNKALVPLYAGIYPRPGRDVFEATPQAIPARGLPTLLRPLGYRSAFFTSATMEFERKDLILENLGFDVIAGAEAIESTGFHEKAYFGFEDRAALEPALRWVREMAGAGRPFFLNFLTLTSHHPYDVPPEFAKKDYGAEDPALNDYYNALRYTDDLVRDLIVGIEKSQALENTIFIVLGDHGEAFREHLERTHGNVVWDEALHVPAIIYAPGLIPAGARITGPRQHIDLLPTISDLLNAPLTGGYLPGRSLMESVPTGRTLYHHALDDRKAMALRRDSLKFLYFFRHAPSKVFNYIADPDERHDISDQYASDVLSKMELELLLWRKKALGAYSSKDGA